MKYLHTASAGLGVFPELLEVRSVGTMRVCALHSSPSPVDNPGDASDSRALDFDLCSSKAKIKDSI